MLAFLTEDKLQKAVNISELSSLEEEDCVTF